MSDPAEPKAEAVGPADGPEGGTSVPKNAPAEGVTEAKIVLPDGRSLTPDEAAKEIARLMEAEKDLKRQYTRKTQELAAMKQRVGSASSNPAPTSEEGREEEEDVDAQVEIQTKMLELYFENQLERLENRHGALTEDRREWIEKRFVEEMEKTGRIPDVEALYKIASWKPPKANAAPVPAGPNVPAPAGVASAPPPAKPVGQMTEDEFRSHVLSRYKTFRSGIQVE